MKSLASLNSKGISDQLLRKKVRLDRADRADRADQMDPAGQVDPVVRGRDKVGLVVQGRDQADLAEVAEVMLSAVLRTLSEGGMDLEAGVEASLWTTLLISETLFLPAAEEVGEVVVEDRASEVEEEAAEALEVVVAGVVHPLLPLRDIPGDSSMTSLVYSGSGARTTGGGPCLVRQSTQTTTQITEITALKDLRLEDR